MPVQEPQIRLSLLICNLKVQNHTGLSSHKKKQTTATNTQTYEYADSLKRKHSTPYDPTWQTATMVIASVRAAHTSTIVLARNKTTHIIRKFTIITHEILTAVAPVAMHMVNADASILARPWYTFINVNTAHVPCNTWHMRSRIFIWHSCLLIWYWIQCITNTYLKKPMGLNTKKLYTAHITKQIFHVSWITASRFPICIL